MENQYCYKYPRPALTTDQVIFGFGEGELRVLLIRRGNEPFKGKWALPGGFMDMDEDAETCARRELEEETGLKVVNFEQLYAFSDVDRDPRYRVVSIAYYALVRWEDCKVKAGDDADRAQWFPLSGIPPLAFDHRRILQMAADRLKLKARRFAEIGAEISEFGTRRRFSFEVQDRVIGILKEYSGKYLKGSSNVCLAMKYNLTPMGTHPHEWFMYHGAHYGYRSANALALANWVDVYDGHLGIALTDTYTTDNFFSSFDTQYAKLFDGLRWDSGDPYVFTEKALKHYREKRIDPRTKTVVYSDALDLEGVENIRSFVNGRLHDVYGIGTFLSNDVGVKPLNMVIKMFECKPQGGKEFWPVVKLSDVEGKHTGDPKEIALCQGLLRI